MRIVNLLYIGVLNVSLVSGMSEFDTLAQIISSSFYCGNPVNEKFIADWADSCPPTLSDRIYASYGFHEADIDEQLELVKAMCVLLGSRLENPSSIAAFHSTIDNYEPAIQRKIVPMLFNYMDR